MATLYTSCLKCNQQFIFDGYVPEKIICIHCGYINYGNELLEEARNNNENTNN